MKRTSRANLLKQTITITDDEGAILNLSVSTTPGTKGIYPNQVCIVYNVWCKDDELFGIVKLNFTKCRVSKYADDTEWCIIDIMEKTR